MQPLVRITERDEEDTTVGRFQLPDLRQESRDVILSRQSGQVTEEAQHGWVVVVDQGYFFALERLKMRWRGRGSSAHAQLVTC